MNINNTLLTLILFGMKKTDNNIIFRASWFLTLERWSPELVKEFIDALHSYYNNTEIEITNDRVLDMWINAQPLLDADREKFNKRVEINRENGRKGGAPEGNKNATKSTEINQEQPKTTEGLNKQPKQPIEKEKEKENDNDIEKEMTILKSYSFVEDKVSDDDIELFTIMFAEFGESDSVYDELFDMWVKLPFNEQEDSVRFSKNFIQYQTSRKKKPSLFFYLKDKKYNWTTIRK